MKGWFFAATDRKLRYGDNRLAAIGVTHTVDGKPECCRHGLHASKRALDALRLGAGPVAFRVTLGGEMDHASDKSAAQSRTYDAGGIDVTDTLIEFACYVAMSAMLLAEHNDQRSWRGVEAALAWTRGEIGRDELRNAYAAAAVLADAYADAAANAAANAAYAAAYAAAAAADADDAAVLPGAVLADAVLAVAVAVAVAAAVLADAYADADADAGANAKTEINALLEQMLEEIIP